jgi:hypothetical protein
LGLGSEVNRWKSLASRPTLGFTDDIDLKVPQRNRIYNQSINHYTTQNTIPKTPPANTIPPKNSIKMDAKTEVMQQVRQQAAIANARALVEVRHTRPLPTIPHNLHPKFSLSPNAISFWTVF